jgi:hypothetical protein
VSDTEKVSNEMCLIRHQMVDQRCEAIEGEVTGMRADLKEVRDLQKTILYAIIGLFAASILTLIGVIAGRVIDFGVFFP